MSQILQEVGGAKVVLYTLIDDKHKHTEKCKQIVAGVLMGKVVGLAICQYEDDSGFYLFGCDQDWQTLTDTWHETIKAAKDQAEFEYEGVTATWQTPQI